MSEDFIVRRHCHNIEHITVTVTLLPSGIDVRGAHTFGIFYGRQRYPEQHLFPGIQRCIVRIVFRCLEFPCRYTLVHQNSAIKVDTEMEIRIRRYQIANKCQQFLAEPLISHKVTDGTHKTLQQGRTDAIQS